MFFEFRIDGVVVLYNLALVTRIKVAAPNGEHAQVTFCFTDGKEESVTLSNIAVQKLYTAVPRPAIYGAGGMG